jgi:2-polyprenyl-6-methoxyphenol hydroxylase-like FAD-dependent oxidoreductase
VGDAAYCCSPLSGQGTSVALLGAYILAGELKLAGDDHGQGYTNYFQLFQPYTERTQWLASDNIPGGEPITQDQFDLVVSSITLKTY